MRASGSAVEGVLRLVASTVAIPALGGWTVYCSPLQMPAAFLLTAALMGIALGAAVRDEQMLQQVVTNRVTDPYSVALTANSQQSLLVDLAWKWVHEHLDEPIGLGEVAAATPGGK